MPWGFAASAAVGLAGSALQSNATGKAAKSAANAQRDAAAQMRSDLMPYMDTGQNALLQVGDAAGLNGPEGNAAALEAFQTSPGYQFQMDQGLRAIDNSASARGMLRSGATMKAAQQFGAGLANQDFTAYYNRLMGLVQTGQASAAGVGAGNQQAAAGIAQTEASAGTAQANAYGSAAQGIGDAIGNWQNNRLYDQRLAMSAAQQAPTRAYGYG